MEVTHVVVECVALLIRIHEVPVHILARQPTLLTKIICGFLQSRQSNSGIVSQTSARVPPFHIPQSFQYIIVIILSLRQYCRTLSTAVHLIYTRFGELALLPYSADWPSQLG
jgi:hypothetical protein